MTKAALLRRLKYIENCLRGEDIEMAWIEVGILIGLIDEEGAKICSEEIDIKEANRKCGSPLDDMNI